MSDLIDRAEVLETYAELYDIFDDNQAIQNEFTKVYEKLRNLPSVQSEIILCKECKHLQTDKPCAMYWCDGKMVKPDHYCGYAERREE